MEISPFWPVLGWFLCLGLHGLVVACEFSLVKLRYAHLDDLILESLRVHPVLGRMLERADIYARSLRFARIFFALLAGVFLAKWLGMLHPVNFPGPLTVVVFLGFSLIYYVGCELWPRAMALKFPVSVLQVSAPVVFLLRILLFPLGFPVRWCRALIYRVMGLDIEDDLSPLDVEVQLRALGVEDTRLSPVSRAVISKAMLLPELVVSDILVPRNQVQWLDLQASTEENLEKARRSGHTRFPLCEGDLDQCIGIIHIKDVFRRGSQEAMVSLRQIRRPVITLGIEDRVEEALQKLLGLKMHMAVVADAFGGIVGVVTLESILEELVGEIQDEFDMEEAQIVSLGKDTYRIHGLTPLHDISERLGIDLEREDVSTLSGLVTAELGKIPDQGERLVVGNLEVEAVKVDEKKLILAEVRILPPPDPDA
jgi:CBS domain containing-hemolysin-like protein